MTLMTTDGHGRILKRNMSIRRSNIGAKEMLAVPLSTYRWVESYDTEGRYSWHYEYVSKAIVVNVNEATGSMSIHGKSTILPS